MESMSIDHVLRIIGVLVAVTSLIITITCGVSLRWINTMRQDFCLLRKELTEFIKLYYDKHEETVKHEECLAKHAVIDRKVDKLHERVDNVESDRR